MPIVSVVMSTYDDAALLPESVESVLSQDFSDFELVVVNDGSPDPHTREIVDSYAKKDRRVRPIYKANQGLTRALIDGCRAAAGRYIARIDVGDVMVPERLGAQTRALESSKDCALVSCHVEYCGPEWEHLWVNRGRPADGRSVALNPELPFSDPNGDVPHHGSVMFRRDTYLQAGGYRVQFYYGQDWDLWYRLSEKGRYRVVPELLYRVRLLANGISLTNANRQRSIAECSRGAFDARKCGEDEVPWLIKADEIRPGPTGRQSGATPNRGLEPGLYFIGEALRRNCDLRCRRYLGEAIKASPLQPRSYIRYLQSLFGCSAAPSRRSFTPV